MVPGTHGSTFGGNPLACAAANAVLDVVLADGFLDHVRSVSEVLAARLHELQAAYPDLISEVRGQGLLLGLRLAPPNTEIAARLLERGLITVPAGDNVLRLMPPLIIEQAQIDEALEILDGLCRKLEPREAAQ
jgi:acetylornithine/N-succinyldiaminopimelate aminotransferase